jgi:hypothetical protein
MDDQVIRNPSRTLAYAGGILQSVAAFLPAVRMRLSGTASFLRVHTTGGVLLAFGIVIIVAANRGRWRWVGAIAGISLVATVLMYVQIVTAPMRMFIDPLMRHVVHPAWGFIPMTFGTVLGLCAAIWSARTSRASDVPVSIGATES